MRLVIKSRGYAIGTVRAWKGQDYIKVSGNKWIRKKDNKGVKLQLGDKTKTKEFKQWFGDWENDSENASKVVNKDGKPLVVYHGTPEAGFKEFAVDRMISREEGGIKFKQFGSFFSSSTDTAGVYTINYKKMLPEAQSLEDKRNRVLKKYLSTKDIKYKQELDKLQTELKNKYPNIVSKLEHGAIYPVYLNIRNPLTVNGKGKLWSNVVPIVFQRNDLNSYDGIIFKNIIEDGKVLQDTYVVFRANQIKSKFNKGSFSNSSNILKGKIDKFKGL